METTNIQQDILKILKTEKDNYINWLPNEIINIIINKLYKRSISNNSLFKQVVDFLKRNINKKVHIESLYDEFNGNSCMVCKNITIKTINDFINNNLYVYGVKIFRPNQIKFTDENDNIYNIYDCSDSGGLYKNHNTRLTVFKDGMRMNNYLIKECINGE